MISAPRSPRWLTPQQMRAWRAFIETVGDLTTALERDLGPTGLTVGDYQVLVYLSESPDRQMRMSELAERLQLTPSGLTRRLDGLVKNHLVARVPSEIDRRVTMAQLTPGGFAVLEEAAPIHVESVQQRIFDHLSPEQVRCLGSAFSAIAAGLESSAS
jgi:DNA-binding MarR family transcriptional regulator